MNTMPQHQSVPEFSKEQDIHLPSSLPILNETLLAQYHAMDEGIAEDPLLPRLISIFEEHFPEHLKRLNPGLKAKDEVEVTYVIHKMLGMAHNVGALRLSNMLMVLENSDTEAKMRLSEEDVARLIQEFEAAAAALQDYLNLGS